MTFGEFILDIQTADGFDAQVQRIRDRVKGQLTRENGAELVGLLTIRGLNCRNSAYAEPNAQRILAICHDEFGETGGNSLLRLRNRLSVRLKCEPDDVGAMALDTFLNEWTDSANRASTPKTLAKSASPADRERWEFAQPYRQKSRPVTWKRIAELWHQQSGEPCDEAAMKQACHRAKQAASNKS